MDWGTIIKFLKTGENFLTFHSIVALIYYSSIIMEIEAENSPICEKFHSLKILIVLHSLAGHLSIISNGAYNI